MRLEGTVKSVIPQTSAAMGKKAGDIVRQTLFGVQARARAGAPIGETGDLASSIDSDIRPLAGGAEGEVTDPMYYAAFVNFGTGGRGAGSDVPLRSEANPRITYSAQWAGMPAQPFMSEAAEQGRAEWSKAWGTFEKGLPHL